MELKKPRAKGKFNADAHSTFPLFVESELGLSVDERAPIACSGIHEGDGVAVDAPAEMIALHTMGNFGKGSNSRSAPRVARTRSKFPPFMRKRQYAERAKWTDAVPPSGPSKRTNRSDPEEIDAANRLRSLIDELARRDVVSEKSAVDEEGSEVIDLLSSDEDERAVARNPSERAEIPRAAGPEGACSISDESFPSKSVVVLPDSDNEKDDYFKDVEPKLCVDESGLNERLILTLEEAYFLAYGIGCLQIFDDNKRALGSEEAWTSFRDSKVDFPASYTVYHHFRSKGWVVKPGVKFGGDFLLYKKGQPFYHASYIVLVRTVIENDKETLPGSDYDRVTVQNLIRMSATTGKEILFADVIVPDGRALEDLKTNPESIRNVRVCETLLRRWVSNRRKKDADYN